MFNQGELENYVDVLFWGLNISRKAKYKKGDIILIRYDNAALHLAEMVFQKIIDMGMHPVLRMALTVTMEKAYFKQASRKQLIFKTPGEQELFEHLNGSIFLHAPESITHLSDIDPKQINTSILAKKYLREIMNNREETGDFSWTLCMFPTHGLAKHAGLSIEAYAEQVKQACFLNHSCAVSQWESIYENAMQIKKWLTSMDIKYYHIVSDQIDMVISQGDQRKWLGISGHNIPSFEIFLSPDWRGTQGTYFANQPSFRNGNYVKNIKLTFEHGVVKTIQAEEGEEFLRKQLTMDAGASRIGEFSLTDKRFSKINAYMANTLFDENYGGDFGNCHIALGSSYSNSYNGDSSTLTKPRKKQLNLFQQ